MGVELVVDNSVVMGWCFEDESDSYAAEILELLGDGVVHEPSV